MNRNPGAPRWSRRAGLAPRAVSRRGFTLIELIVSVLLLVVGIAGLASTSSNVSRMIGGGSQQTLAASVADSRFERLRSFQCSKVVGGTAQTGTISESWSVSAVSTTVFDVTDSVTFAAMSRHKPISAVYRSYVRCN